jgi:hypothetical protein
VAHARSRRSRTLSPRSPVATSLMRTSGECRRCGTGSSWLAKGSCDNGPQGSRTVACGHDRIQRRATS